MFAIYFSHEFPSINALDICNLAMQLGCKVFYVYIYYVDISDLFFCLVEIHEYETFIIFLSKRKG